MDDVGGFVEPGYGPVADAFRANFAERDEVGAACSVVAGNKTVVDLWGGYRDRKRTTPWTEDTLVTMYSTSKGMAATAMAVAHSRGLFDLEQPVCSYWPEFGANGKERVTVDQLLRHEAGLAVIDTKIDLATIGDFERLGKVLAEQRPGWEPGTRRGYHAMTLGWYQSQLLARVDPQGRTIGKFFADEVADVLDVEFHIGLPSHVAQSRIAPIIPATRLGQALNFREVPWPILKKLMNPMGASFKAFANPRALSNMASINKRDVLALEMPSFNGTGTPRAVATVYGDLATGGNRLGVSGATLACIEATATPALDEIFGIESAFSCGFMKPFPILPFGSSPRAFGHTGMGGSFGYADPDKGIGFCYAMTRAGYSLPTDPRELALRDALTSCLD